MHRKGLTNQFHVGVKVVFSNRCPLHGHRIILQQITDVNSCRTPDGFVNYDITSQFMSSFPRIVLFLPNTSNLQCVSEKGKKKTSHLERAMPRGNSCNALVYCLRCRKARGKDSCINLMSPTSVLCTSSDAADTRVCPLLEM